MQDRSTGRQQRNNPTPRQPNYHGPAACAKPLNQNNNIMIFETTTITVISEKNLGGVKHMYHQIQEDSLHLVVHLSFTTLQRIFLFSSEIT